jgi:pimeloyl-ACP methyl ester carboxylesterase
MPPSMPHVDGVEHREVSVRGLRVHVAVAGQEGGSPVLLQHGWPQHWYEWRHLMGPLAQAGYRVIAPDFRGFGWSEYPPDEDFRKETLVDDLIALCGALGYGRVAFVGHDWGAWAGWLLCLRRPDLVERAVLLSAPPPFPPDRTDLAALGRIGRLAYQLPLAAPLPYAAKRAFFQHGRSARRRPPDDVEVYAATLVQRSQVRATTLLYRQFLTREVGPLIARRYGGRRLRVPVRYLVGEEDPLFYEGMVDEPAAHSDGDFAGEVLRGIGHFVPDEAADLLRERVLGFLGAATAGAGLGAELA